MDLKAHIQAARRVPLAGDPVRSFAIDSGGLADGRHRDIDRSEALPLAVLGSLAVLTLFWLAL